MTSRSCGDRRRYHRSRGVEAEQPLVIIVDDDASVREALSELILSAGFQPVCFASTRELLDADILDSPGCLILDVRMPGASGLDLQHHLAQSGNPKPIIFLTGHGDIPMTVQAMKAGAVDFLTKPVRDQTLLDAVIAGIAMDAAQRAEAAVVKRNVERLETLTPRERRSCAKSRVDGSTSRSPSTSASARSPSSSTAATSCARWRPRPSAS